MYTTTAGQKVFEEDIHSHRWPIMGKSYLYSGESWETFPWSSEQTKPHQLQDKLTAYTQLGGKKSTQHYPYNILVKKKFILILIIR